MSGDALLQVAHVNEKGVEVKYFMGWSYDVPSHSIIFFEPFEVQWFTRGS